MHTMTMLDAALWYASRGYAVFPCSPLTKVPFDHSGGSRDATTDETKIREWWTRTPTANVAIATGAASGLHVVDVDAPASDVMPRLPLTWIARTRAGGWHYVYKYPEGIASLPNTSKGAKDPLHPDCDTRGQGGYVLVYPSVVEDNGVQGRYSWTNDVEPVELPGWIVEKIKPKPVAHVPRETYAMVSTSWAEKALREECDAVASMGEGGRNHRLNQAAFSLGQIVAGGHLSLHVVQGDLRSAGLACGLLERETVRTIKSGLSAGMRHPRSPRQELAAWKPDPFGGAEITLDGDDDEALEVAPLPAPRKDTDDGDERRWQLLNAVRSLGGLCDSYTAWVVRGADHPQPGLTIASLLALGSVLAGRRLVYRRALSSLYVVSLGGSAEGKNRPQACLGRVIDEVWPALAGPNSFSSGASFIDSVRKSVDAGVGSCLVLDEYGMQLAAMIGPRAPAHRVDLKQSLTELSTKGTDKWSPAISMVKGGGKLELWAPSLTLLGSTTPESLHGVLTSTDVADGFVGRHVWFRAQEVLPMWQPPETRGDDSLPIDVRAAVGALRSRHEEWHMGLTVSVDNGLDTLRLYDPQHVQETAEAARMLLEYKLQCDEDRRQHRRLDVPRATLGRSPEFASRIALILAALSQPEQAIPTVTELEVRVAIALADESAQTFADSLATNRRASWDDPAAQVEMVVSAVRMAGGEAVRSQVLRACQRLTAQQVNEACERLVLEERAVIDKVATKGRPSVVIRLL